jgi:hypothetical protein
MKQYIVIDHRGNSLAIWKDLKTNRGAINRAKRLYPTAAKIEVWYGDGRPYYNPDNKPNLIINL